MAAVRWDVLMMAATPVVIGAAAMAALCWAERRQGRRDRQQ